MSSDRDVLPDLRTCEDCAEAVAEARVELSELAGAALHVAAGAFYGGSACDHVDYSVIDEARAFEALWSHACHQRDRARHQVETLKEEQVAFVRALEKAQAENERLREALAAARALVGVVHVIDPRKGHSVHVPAEDDFYWVSDGVHTEDCSACALERTIDAALALETDEGEASRG